MFGGLNSYPIYRQAGLLSSLKKINLGSILTNTQKTLNIVNQAIPLIYQVKPIVDNAKTMFKIMGAVKEDETSSPIRNNKKINNNINNNTINNTNVMENYNNSNQPKFFI